MKIGVLGAGTMGSGIAYAFAQAGYDVVLRTRKQTTLDKAMGYMKKTLDKAVAKGKMSRPPPMRSTPASLPPPRSKRLPMLTLSSRPSLRI